MMEIKFSERKPAEGQWCLARIRKEPEMELKDRAIIARWRSDVREGELEDGAYASDYYGNRVLLGRCVSWIPVVVEAAA